LDDDDTIVDTNKLYNIMPRSGLHKSGKHNIGTRSGVFQEVDPGFSQCFWLKMSDGTISEMTGFKGARGDTDEEDDDTTTGEDVLRSVNRDGQRRSLVPPDEWVVGTVPGRGGSSGQTSRTHDVAGGQFTSGGDELDVMMSRTGTKWPSQLRQEEDER
jgi:hypothetical protein